MEQKEQPSNRASPWNWLLSAQFLALFCIIGFLFNESTTPLFARWIKWDEDLSHAIPTIFALLFLALRIEKLPYQANSKSTRALLLICVTALSIIWLMFVLANITLLANFTILISIPIVLAASYSLKTMRFLAPTLGILLFTLPIFSQLNDSLVFMSAHVVGFLIHLSGITALIEGQNIFIPSGHIFIADGCSGLRYLTISILLGYLLSILNNYNIRQSFITLVVSISLGLLTNWLRIFSLVVIGDLTEMKSSLMHDHEMFGWILFSCVMLPTIFLSPIYPTKKIEVESKLILKPILPLLALAVGPILFSLIPNTAETTRKFSLESAGVTPQQAPGDLLLASKLPASNFTEYASTHINNTDFHIQLRQYRPEKLREKIIPYFQSLYNNEEWQTVKQENSNELKEFGYKTTILKRTGSQTYALLVYRFEIGKNNTGNYEIAKLLQIPATIAGNRYLNIFTVHSLCSTESCAKEIESATQIAMNWDKATKNLR